MLSTRSGLLKVTRYAGVEYLSSGALDAGRWKRPSQPGINCICLTMLVCSHHKKQFRHGNIHNEVSSVHGDPTARRFRANLADSLASSSLGRPLLRHKRSKLFSVNSALLDLADVSTRSPPPHQTHKTMVSIINHSRGDMATRSP
jgi:hypothetical protein